MDGKILTLMQTRETVFLQQGLFMLRQGLQELKLTQLAHTQQIQPNIQVGMRTQDKRSVQSPSGD